MENLRYLADVVTLELDPDACNGCGMCAVVCPHAVFLVEDRLASIVDRNACMECGACALNCPTGAITVESGVGCAWAIIQGWFKGTGPNCSCGSEKEDQDSCCG